MSKTHTKLGFQSILTISNLSSSKVSRAQDLGKNELPHPLCFEKTQYGREDGIMGCGILRIRHPIRPKGKYQIPSHGRFRGRT